MNHVTLQSDSEKKIIANLTAHLKQTKISDDELLANLGLFLTSKNLSRLLFFNEIYKMILETHGVIMEFGVRWGQTMSLMSAMRGIYEPFNRHRKIIGFDTFEGLAGCKPSDGQKAVDGAFSVPKGYEARLDEILCLQEKLNPVPHLKKHEIIKGDAEKTIPKYFNDHPETLVSLAVLDFDIYNPTFKALQWMKSRMFKGSVLVFDELCDDVFPGETLALLSAFNLNSLRIRRFPFASRLSYAVIE